VGFINSFIGAGGGMIAVPILKRSGLCQNEAHASAVAVILPLTVISAVMYLHFDYVALPDIYPYMLLGIAGAVFGSLLLPKIPANLLKKIFGFFMMYAGVRMIFR
jgi:uncharacterized membrane protein YfcA